VCGAEPGNILAISTLGAEVEDGGDGQANDKRQRCEGSGQQSKLSFARGCRLHQESTFRSRKSAMASFDFLLLRCGLERPGAFSVMTTSLVVLRLLAKYSRNNPQESNLQKTHLIYRRVAKQGKMTQIFSVFSFHQLHRVMLYAIPRSRVYEPI
jgi:hypothetical protein